MAAVVLPIGSITNDRLSRTLTDLSGVERKTVITIKNHSPHVLDKHSVYFYSGTSDWGIPGPVSNSEAFMWSVPFDYNIYSNWWSILVYDGFIEANDDLYREMYYGSPNKGDSQTYQGDLNLGWRYEGFMGHSGIPFIVVDIYKD